jgi:short-subunit dehydrogenase
MFKRPFIIFYLVLVSLMIFQILLLLNKAVKGIHKYFFLNEKDLLDRYGGAGSWVVITGASSGQGYDMALAFAKRGFNLLMIGSKRTDKTAEIIARDYPLVKTKVIHKDFRQAFQEDFFNDIQTTFDEIGLDLAVLVNNVGHRVGWNPYHEMKSSYIRDVIATGTIVQSRLTHMVIPFFLKRNEVAMAERANNNRKQTKTSALINITAQCMHPNFLFGITLSNEISVPYLSVYEAANAFGFYQGNSIYKEYQGQFDILNITPGAVVTDNTGCLKDTLFNVPSAVYVAQIMKMIGNVQGHSCAYWGHALSNYLINLAPTIKDNMLKKVGETIARDFMYKAKHDTDNKYTIENLESTPPIKEDSAT